MFRFTILVFAPGFSRPEDPDSIMGFQFRIRHQSARCSENVRPL